MILPSEMFTYNNVTRTMSAFASDGYLHTMFKPGSGIPVNMTIQSHRTGNIIVADYLSRREAGGECVSWTYFNHEHNLSVEIFND